MQKLLSKYYAVDIPTIHTNDIQKEQSLSFFISKLCIKIAIRYMKSFITNARILILH